MSGRIRTIKPELLEDAVTAGLSNAAFRLFVGSLLLADDYGNLRFEPGWLRGQVFWARSVTAEEFAAAIQELVTASTAGGPLVTSYTVNGQRYGAIRGWSKHQKVQHPGKPRVPGPLMTLSGEPHETLAPDLRSPINDHDPDPDPDHQAPLPVPDVNPRSGVIVPEPRETQPKRTRGSRLADDWTPSAETQAWARKEGVADPCGRVLDEFRDFWRGVPGARGVKLDWDATYRNRVRQVAQRQPVQHGGASALARRPFGPGGGPRGDRQGLDGWTPPPQATGTDGNPFGGDS